MIHFKDFVPQRLKQSTGVFGWNRGADVHESLEETLVRANEWIEKSPIFKVLNVETLLLPNIFSRDEKVKTRINLNAGEIPTWYQVIRVWYQ